MICPDCWSTEQVLNLGIMLVLGGGFAGWLGGIVTLRALLRTELRGRR